MLTKGARPSCRALRAELGFRLPRVPSQMRKLFTAWLVASCLSCVAADEGFTLSAKLLRPQKADAPLRLVIELRNVSGQPQRVVALTNLFEGQVYVRDATGDVHEFIQTNYWNMM